MPGTAVSDAELYLSVDPDAVGKIMANLRRSAVEQLRDAITTGTIPHPSGAGLRDSILRARKISGTVQIAVDPADLRCPEDVRAAREQSNREHDARLDQQLATHAELLRLHPADDIPRAFLLEHQPHEAGYSWRELECRRCPEVCGNDGDSTPAEWPCGPWQLVNERTPR